MTNVLIHAELPPPPSVADGHICLLCMSVVCNLGGGYRVMDLHSLGEHLLPAMLWVLRSSCHYLHNCCNLVGKLSSF